jgi:sporulation protein YlmC with PRC-barrel domain
MRKILSKVFRLSKNEKDTSKGKQLVGKSVIDQDGCLVGTVKDVGFIPGKAGLSLSVENSEGETREISWESIQGAADFIVLKPIVQAQQAAVSAAPVIQQPQPQYMQSPQVAQPVQPVQSANPAQPLCPSCRSPLTWIPQYKQWYCYKEQKYPYAKA